MFRQAGRPVPGSPQWSSRKTSPTARLRALLHDVVGGPYDRNPCPHVRRVRALVLHPTQDPLVHHGHRTVVMTTDLPCVRPADHVRESRLIPDKHGETITVPDDAARLHADDTGHTW